MPSVVKYAPGLLAAVLFIWGVANRDNRSAASAGIMLTAWMLSYEVALISKVTHEDPWAWLATIDWVAAMALTLNSGHSLVELALAALYLVSIALRLSHAISVQIIGEDDYSSSMAAYRIDLSIWWIAYSVAILQRMLLIGWWAGGGGKRNAVFDSGHHGFEHLARPAHLRPLQEESAG